MGEHPDRRLLGRGAMGAIYLERTEDGATRAVKYPRADTASAVVATYDALTGLAHDNLVAVDAVERDGDPRIVLEHVDGPSVGDLLRLVKEADEDVPVGVALEIVGQSAAGLAALHAHRSAGASEGWVHRDVSPSNLLVGRDGIVRVADLDVAAPAGQRADAPPVPCTGKTQYASPEQQEGSELTARSDVFSLGVVLVELLSGRPLFAHGRPEQSQLAARAAEQLEERDDAPPELVELLLEMLAARPGDRPAASDVHRRLEALRGELPPADLGAYVLSFARQSAAHAVPARAEPGGASDRGWHVKGAAVDATIDFLVQHYGEAGYGRVAEMLSSRTLDALSQRIDATAWYDGAVVVELTDAAQQLFGGRPGSLARAIGAWSAERALSPGGPYQTFRDKGLRKGVPAFLEATEDIYGLYYDQGQWRVEAIEGTDARFSLSGVRYPDAVTERIFAYLRRGMEMAGAHDVRLEHEDDGSRVRVRVEWTA